MNTPFQLPTSLAFDRFRWLALLVCLPVLANAAIPPADQLLPADTLLVISAADCSQLRETWGKAPMGKFIADPAMKAFRDKFITKWKEDFIGPLERELGVKMDDYSSLLRGQLTFAVTQDGWKGGGDSEPAMLLLVDTREKSAQLKTNLAELRKKWVDAGKAIKTETIRNVEFWTVTMSSNNIPAPLRTFFPQRQEIHELGKEDAVKPEQGKLLIGQHESLLIIGSSASSVETLVARLTGGSVPALADEAAFESSRNAVFRDAPIFAWFNAKRLLDLLLALPPEQPNPEAPSPLPQISLMKLISATGLGGLKTVALAWRNSDEGSTIDLSIGAPESSRAGILKLLAADAKDSSPPPFVPADALKFQRWRMDNQKALATIEKMIGEFSPQAINVWNFLIATGNEAGKQGGDDGFNLRANLFGNLGDDLISYTKPPRGTSPAELNAPPSLLLIGSPNADKVAASLKGLLAIVSPSMAPKEREFIGKKIYSLSMSRGFIGAAGLAGKTLNYAASGGYVAISTDTAMLEEYLRSSETPPKPLREKPGLAEAAQKVGGQSTGLFNYENESEKMKALFAVLKAGAGKPDEKNDSLDLLAGSIPFANPEKSIKSWLDYSLLPEFETVSKYFYFSVYSASANADGVTYKFFSPAPPESR